MLNRAYLPLQQVCYHSVVHYSLPEPPFDHQRAALTAKTYTGQMSAGAVRRIRQAVDILLQVSPLKTVWNPITQALCTFKLTFVTLTISARKLIAHREAYRLGLGPFLDWLRRKGCRHYIWKAELQDRGQIHYHVTTDIFIPYYDLRNEWNRLQGLAGWLDEFRAAFRHSNPNSTDIHAVHRVQRLDLYLSKYVAKSVGSGKIDGKVWGCDRGLMKARAFRCEREQIEEDRAEEAIRTGKAREFKLEFCRFVDMKDPVSLLEPKNVAAYRQWLKSV